MPHGQILMTQQNEYISELEKRVEELQDRLSSAEGAVQQYMHIRYTATSTKLIANLYCIFSNSKDPQMYNHKVFEATKTKVDDEDKWYIEWHTGELGHCDAKYSIEEVLYIGLKKLKLLCVDRKQMEISVINIPIKL